MQFLWADSLQFLWAGSLQFLVLLKDFLRILAVFFVVSRAVGLLKFLGLLKDFLHILAEFIAVSRGCWFYSIECSLEASPVPLLTICTVEY